MMVDGCVDGSPCIQSKTQYVNISQSSILYPIRLTEGVDYSKRQISMCNLHYCYYYNLLIVI